jgi:YVTN family beta-propeller protein
MMKIAFKYCLLFLSLPVLMSCSEEENKPKDTGFLHGLYIVNEGNFMSNNGSISYYNPDSARLVNTLFQTVNQRILGDVVQSFGVADDKGFIVVNNSQKVEVVDMETFVSIGTITGTDYPRYFLKISKSKGYLTNGAFAGHVIVIDLNTLSVVKTIAVGYGPENLVRWNDKVFVANSGGWTHDNKISVIDVDADVVTDSIQVGDNPIDLAADKNGNIWVLCKGNVVYDQGWNIIDETDSQIHVINSDDLSILKSFSIGQTGDFFNPVRLACSHDGNVIYYLEADGIYKMDIGDTNPPGSPFIARSFYGLDVDQNNGTIYGLSANNFTTDGYLFRYTTSGILIDSLKVGIGPNSVVTN